MSACSGGRSSALLGWLTPHKAAQAAPASKHAHAPPAPPLSQGMVDAVTNSRGKGLVEMKFALRGRPVVGRPAELDLEIIPSQPLVRLVATYHAEPALGLQGGAGTTTTQRDRPDAGVPIRHALTIVPRKDGIFLIDATVLAETGTESVARTFMIPVIAGNGIQ